MSDRAVITLYAALSGLLLLSSIIIWLDARRRYRTALAFLEEAKALRAEMWSCLLTAGWGGRPVMSKYAAFGSSSDIVRVQLVTLPSDEVYAVRKIWCMDASGAYSHCAMTVVAGPLSIEGAHYVREKPLDWDGEYTGQTPLDARLETGFVEEIGTFPVPEL